MKTLAIHSCKGGVGKTTVALLLAKYLTIQGNKVCVLDYDFIGAGIAGLFGQYERPECYLEQYFIEPEYEKLDICKLLTKYCNDKDMGNESFSLVLNMSKGNVSGNMDQIMKDRLESNMSRKIAEEPNFHQIRTKTKSLIEKIKNCGFDILIIDCHPGLSYISQTVRPLADNNIYVTTPNRSDCFGILKYINLKKLDTSTAFLLLNKEFVKKESVENEEAKGYGTESRTKRIIDVHTFRSAIENDAVLRQEARTLFSCLAHIAQKDSNFVIIPESDEMRLIFYIGTSEKLPKILIDKEEFKFCEKIEKFIFPGNKVS